jgi:hypothetical protein
LNALNILQGEVPGHIDHPGTTLQVIGAGVVGATWLMSSAVGATDLPLVDAVLSDPERYLRSINFVLTVLTAAALLALSFRLRDVLGGIGFGLLAQLALLASPSVLVAVTNVNPETLLIPAILVLATIVSPIALERREQQSGRRAVLTGGVLGFAIATKFTAIACLFFIFLFRGWKRRALATAAAVLTFLICTVPIWPRYPDMFAWLLSLATHSGRYGRGEVGLPAVATMMHSAAQLMRAESVLPLTLMISSRD